MAKLTISFDATAGTVTQSWGVWDAGKETRFLNWVWNNYAPKDTTEGSPTFGEVLPRTNPNMATAFKSFALAIMEGVKANVLREEKESAVKNIVTTDL